MSTNGTAHKSVAEALLAFQSEAPTLPKDATNPHFKSKYTPLDTIIETVTPILVRHGLCWTTLPGMDEQGRPALTYQLHHAASNEQIEGTMPLLLGKSDSQGLGSALTYSRRYALSAVLNLASDEDDDGNAASRPQAKTAEGPALVTPQHIESLKRAAKGLAADQIKLALTACGVPIPDPLVWNKIPKDKATILYEALSQTPRTGAKAA